MFYIYGGYSMPKIYLSPSTQEYNTFYSTSPQENAANTEEYYMNLIVDSMVPYLESNNIQFRRNTKDMNIRQIVDDSNNYRPDLHVAIHSNASPPEFSGILQGPDVFHFPASGEGKEAADYIAEQMREIYPIKELISVLPNDRLVELTGTFAPAVYVETAYHDNPSDAAWIKANINQIARAISKGIAEYFGIEFRDISPRWRGEVSVREGNLNVRSLPSTQANVVGKLQNNDNVIILRSMPDWYLIAADDVTGYVDKRYIKPL